MYLAYFPDGSMMITLNGDYSDFIDGTKLFTVHPSLTVEDISEVNSGNGWEREVFPSRLEGKITLIVK